MDSQSYRITSPLIADAEVEARRLGHSYIGPEHLLLAVATNADGACRTFFDRHGLSRDALRQSVTTLSGERVVGLTDDTPLTIEVRSQLALARALIAASTRPDRSLAFTPDELLTALLADDVAPDAVVGAVLERVGLSPSAAREELAALSSSVPPS